MSNLEDLNRLEAIIMAAEDDADRHLWTQAESVVSLLQSGMTQREVAAGWLNGRTGEPYAVSHVNYVKQVFVQFTEQVPRPRFRDVYNQIANPPHVARNAGEHEWYTPAEIIEAARRVMGDIDLDPASSVAAQEVVRARRFFTREQDGLSHHWHGRVWLNPPYSQPWIDDFCLKLEAEFGAGNILQAIVLTNNATETHWGQVLLANHAAVCFHDGRVKFWSPTKESVPLQGQMLTYFGPNVMGFCHEFASRGAICLNAKGLLESSSVLAAATGISAG